MNDIDELRERIALLEEDRDRLKSPLGTHRQDQIAAIAGIVYLSDQINLSLKSVEEGMTVAEIMAESAMLYDAAVGGLPE